VSEHIYLLTLGLPILAVLLIFAMRYRTRAAEAKVSATAQADTATALGAIRASVADLGARLSAVEKILKDVE
jgi:hypothetical protein